MEEKNLLELVKEYEEKRLQERKENKMSMKERGGKKTSRGVGGGRKGKNKEKELEEEERKNKMNEGRRKRE